jgi:hypothetical protein
MSIKLTASVKIRMVEINTTNFEEENFIIVTNLSDKQIQKIIEPIVMKERDSEDDNGDDFYDNEMLLEELKKAYPKNLVEPASIENLTI